MVKRDAIGLNESNGPLLYSKVNLEVRRLQVSAELTHRKGTYRLIALRKLIKSDAAACHSPAVKTLTILACCLLPEVFSRLI
jgi:hypothetical protein